MRRLPCCIALVGCFLVATPACAQTPSQPASRTPSPTSRTELITLGTGGGPLPRKDRAQSSNLLVVNGTPYLIDAGAGTTRRIVQSGQNFLQVRRIFITHPHSDHYAGLATLLIAQWEQTRSERVEIYGSGAEKIVNGAIEYLSVNTDVRWSEGRRTPMAEVVKGHDVGPGVIYQDDNIKVTAVENTHFHVEADSPAAGKYKSYAYRFETADRTIVFTGDTGPSEAVTDLAKGADILVTEVSVPDEVVELQKRSGVWQRKSPQEQGSFVQHMMEEHVTPEAVGTMAARANVKMVIMSHLTPSVRPDDDYQRYADEAAKFFPGRIVVAKDLMKF